MTIFDADVALFRAIHVNLHRPWLDGIMLALSITGLGAFQAGVLVVSFFPKRTRDLAWRAGIALLAAALIRLPIMSLAHRMRPSNFAWAHPLENIYSATTSFPSGHTCSSFAFATALWVRLRHTDYAWVSHLLWVWACLVGFSRIYIGVHYPLDVLGGAILGVLVGGFVAEWLFRAQPSKSG